MEKLNYKLQICKWHLGKRNLLKKAFLFENTCLREKNYNKKIKIIEHESDIDSAYPSRLQCFTNNKLIEILGNNSKLLKMILNFYKNSNV